MKVSRQLAAHWIAWWVGDIFHSHWRGETRMAALYPRGRTNYSRSMGVVAHDRALVLAETMSTEEMKRLVE